MIVPSFPVPHWGWRWISSIQSLKAIQGPQADFKGSWLEEDSDFKNDYVIVMHKWGHFKDDVMIVHTELRREGRSDKLLQYS